MAIGAPANPGKRRWTILTFGFWLPLLCSAAALLLSWWAYLSLVIASIWGVDETRQSDLFSLTWPLVGLDLGFLAGGWLAIRRQFRFGHERVAWWLIPLCLATVAWVLVLILTLSIPW